MLDHATVGSTIQQWRASLVQALHDTGETFDVISGPDDDPTIVSFRCRSRGPRARARRASTTCTAGSRAPGGRSPATSAAFIGQPVESGGVAMLRLALGATTCASCRTAPRRVDDDRRLVELIDTRRSGAEGDERHEPGDPVPRGGRPSRRGDLAPRLRPRPAAPPAGDGARRVSRRTGRTTSRSRRTRSPRSSRPAVEDGFGLEAACVARGPARAAGWAPPRSCGTPGEDERPRSGRVPAPVRPTVVLDSLGELRARPGCRATTTVGLRINRRSARPGPADMSCATDDSKFGEPSSQRPAIRRRLRAASRVLRAAPRAQRLVARPARYALDGIRAVLDLRRRGRRGPPPARQHRRRDRHRRRAPAGRRRLASPSSTPCCSSGLSRAVHRRPRCAHRGGRYYHAGVGGP